MMLKTALIEKKIEPKDIWIDGYRFFYILGSFYAAGEFPPFPFSQQMAISELERITAANFQEK